MACLSCCCCRLPAKEEGRPLILDVNQVLSDEAWITFKDSLGYFRRKFIKRSNFKIEVPENYFVYDQIGKPKFEPVDQLLGNCLGNIKALSTSNIHVNKDSQENHQKSNGDTLSPPPIDGRDAQADDKHGDERPDEAVSLDTTFYNGTAEKQTYQFKFSKVRTTKLDVSYQKGFTVGGKASFSIGLPKSLASGSLGLSAEKRLEVKNSQCQTFEDSVTMEATSDLNVAPNSKYVAKVQLEERLLNVKFKVRIRMSMPQGRAPIYIRRKSDSVLVFVFNVNNLEDIFEEGRFPCVEKAGDGDWGKVDFIVEGVVKGSLACDHTINLTSQ